MPKGYRRQSGDSWEARGSELAGLWAAVACAAESDCSGAGTDDEPEGVASQAQPHAPSLCGFDRGIALASERNDFCGVVGGIEFRNCEPRLAGTAVLNKIVERLQIGSPNPRGGSVG
jgi:hypothetical protein